MTATEEKLQRLREYKKMWARANRRPLTAEQILKSRERAKEWALNNPERARVGARRWAVENREKVRQNSRRHRESESNREKINARIKAWGQQNKPLRRAMGARYEAAEATPKWLTAIHLAQIQEFYDIAEARNVQTGIEHHVDHIHPLRGRAFRGLHVPWNLQVLEGHDNRTKAAKLMNASLASTGA